MLESWFPRETPVQPPGRSELAEAIYYRFKMRAGFQPEIELDRRWRDGARRLAVVSPSMEFVDWAIMRLQQRGQAITDPSVLALVLPEWKP